MAVMPRRGRSITIALSDRERRALEDLSAERGEPMAVTVRGILHDAPTYRDAFRGSVVLAVLEGQQALPLDEAV